MVWRHVPHHVRHWSGCHTRLSRAFNLVSSNLSDGNFAFRPSGLLTCLKVGLYHRPSHQCRSDGAHGHDSSDYEHPNWSQCLHRIHRLLHATWAPACYDMFQDLRLDYHVPGRHLLPRSQARSLYEDTTTSDVLSPGCRFAVELYRTARRLVLGLWKYSRRLLSPSIRQVFMPRRPNLLQWIDRLGIDRPPTHLFGRRHLRPAAVLLDSRRVVARLLLFPGQEVPAQPASLSERSCSSRRNRLYSPVSNFPHFVFLVKY